jgi:FMN-dependent NADH-azoreductase
MKLLHLDSSITGDRSVTRELSASIVQRLLAGDPAIEVTYRDLASEGLPHVTPITIPSAHMLSHASGPLDADAQDQRAQSDRVLREFLDADVIVVGVPMYNFTIPSQLKAWIDRIVVPGTTFTPTQDGPVGLVSDKRVIATLARGGFYSEGSAMASADHAESYIRLVLGFIGITDIEFVVAEGLSQGEANHAEAVRSARDAVSRLAA